MAHLRWHTSDGTPQMAHLRWHTSDSNFSLHTSDDTPQVAHLKWHTSNGTPQIAHLRLHTSDCTPQIAHLRWHTSDGTPQFAHLRWHTSELEYLGEDFLGIEVVQNEIKIVLNAVSDDYSPHATFMNESDNSAVWLLGFLFSRHCTVTRSCTDTGHLSLSNFTTLTNLPNCGCSSTEQSS